MFLVYASEAAIPSRSTNSNQTMRMCDAFASAGAEVTLVHTRNRAEPPEGYRGDVPAFYGTRHAFRRLTLPSAPAVLLGGFGLLSRLARALPFAVFIAWRSRSGSVPFLCYTRSPLVAWIAVQARRIWRGRMSFIGIAIEIHDEPPTRSAWRLFEKLDAVVVISDALRRRIVGARPALAERVWVEPDGVDLESINPGRLDRDRARANLGLVDVHGPVVVYTGRAIAGKGVDVLLEAGGQLERLGGRLLIVGKVYDAEYTRHAGTNVTFTGFLPPAEVPQYLAAADVLVLPTTPDLVYAAYTSPLKLFEYMASGRPIVASDLPVIREVLTDGQNALLYPPRDPAALASAVERVTADRGLASALADRAWHDVQAFSWERRAERILDRLGASGPAS